MVGLSGGPEVSYHYRRRDKMSGMRPSIYAVYTRRGLAADGFIAWHFERAYTTIRRVEEAERQLSRQGFTVSVVRYVKVEEYPDDDTQD